MQRGRQQGEKIRMQACGVVTLVQEQRFELLGDDGTRRHFTLAHDAPLGWHELTHLLSEGCRVAVRHDAPQPGHTTAAAHGLARLQPDDRATAHASGGRMRGPS
jgi:hypothetical protein